jgi:hypothetical protein
VAAALHERARVSDGDGRACCESLTTSVVADAFREDMDMAV